MIKGKLIQRWENKAKGEDIPPRQWLLYETFEEGFGTTFIILIEYVEEDLTIITLIGWSGVAQKEREKVIDKNVRICEEKNPVLSFLLQDWETHLSDCEWNCPTLQNLEDDTLSGKQENFPHGVMVRKKIILSAINTFN